MEIRSLPLIAFLQSGATRNRTGDTRIFSPKYCNSYSIDIHHFNIRATLLVKTFWKTESVFLVKLIYPFLLSINFFISSMNASSFRLAHGFLLSNPVMPQ